MGYILATVAFILGFAVLVRIFVRTSTKNKITIIAASVAMCVAAGAGIEGLVAIALVATAIYVAYDYATKFGEMRRKKREAEMRHAGAVFGEEFFRKQEEARMRQNMRDINVPKRIGDDDSEAIKMARASLIRRVK